MPNSNTFELKIDSNIIELFTALQGTVLSSDELKSISLNADYFQVCSGCIESLGFDQDGLSRVTLNLASNRITLSKENISGDHVIGGISNISDFQAVLKNALDFGFRVNVVVKNEPIKGGSNNTRLFSVVVTATRCSISSVAYSLSGAGGGGSSSGA